MHGIVEKAEDFSHAVHSFELFFELLGNLDFDWGILVLNIRGAFVTLHNLCF